jgi:hypothetical protein
VIRTPGTRFVGYSIRFERLAFPFQGEEDAMNRIQLLAAETFHYSYDNYHDHLGVNARFDRLMPNEVEMLEKATDEKRPLNRIAEEWGGWTVRVSGSRSRCSRQPVCV